MKVTAGKELSLLTAFASFCDNFMENCFLLAADGITRRNATQDTFHARIKTRARGIRARIESKFGDKFYDFASICVKLFALRVCQRRFILKVIVT